MVKMISNGYGNVWIWNSAILVLFNQNKFYLVDSQTKITSGFRSLYILWYIIVRDYWKVWPSLYCNKTKVSSKSGKVIGFLPQVVVVELLSSGYQLFSNYEVVIYKKPKGILGVSWYNLYTISYTLNITPLYICNYNKW